MLRYESSGRYFRDYHLLLDDHAEQIFYMTDDIAERARKVGEASFIRAATYRDVNVSKTTTRTSSGQRTCWRSSVQTISGSRVSGAPLVRSAMRNRSFRVL